ncbi:MAG: hypothetical protein LBT47_10640, partial [Deltaproteobacteria bacterium]|nr:hypothetical protein [Deltaproteobacteria bacterium]
FQPTHELFESTLEFCQISCWQRIILEAGRQRPGLLLNSYHLNDEAWSLGWLVILASLIFQPNRTLIGVKTKSLVRGRTLISQRKAPGGGQYFGSRF